jgi:hypothetical protein
MIRTVSAGTRRTRVIPLAISALLVVPFVVLEWMKGGGVPVVLFTFMWVHALFIALALLPGIRRLRNERRLGALTPVHWVGLVIGALLVYVYVGVVVDQLPCFLGVPNCD